MYTLFRLIDQRRGELFEQMTSSYDYLLLLVLTSLLNAHSKLDSKQVSKRFPELDTGEGEDKATFSIDVHQVTIYTYILLTSFEAKPLLI